MYFTPLAGGYLADRHFGQRKMVIAGGAIMAAVRDAGGRQLTPMLQLCSRS